MPAANPLVADYNTGYTSGINAGTTASTFTSSLPGGMVGGSANVVVGALVAGSLVVLVALHLLGFRFAFDVTVGRRG